MTTTTGVTDEDLRDLRTTAERVFTPGEAAAPDRWNRAAELGWLALPVPEERGGAGAGPRAAAVVAEAIGRAAAPEPFVAGSVLASAWLSALPPGAPADGVLASIVDGSRTAVAWQPESGALDGTGVDLASTVDGVSLSGRAWWVADPDADAFLVLVRSPDGEPHVVRCPADLPGLTRVTLQLADGSRCAHVDLDHAALPHEAVLASGPAVPSALADAVDLGLVLVAAELTGIARRALDLTLEHLRTRHQFGRPLGAFQSAQHAAVDMYTQVRLSAAALAAALHEWDRPDATATDRAAAASSAKARAVTAARHVTTKAVHLHGALGFSDEYELGRYVNRALVLSAFLGNAADHRRRHHALVAASPVSQVLRTTPVPDGTSRGEPVRFGVAQEHDWNALSDEQFRAHVRAEFEAHHPTAIRYPSRRLYWSEQGDWFRRMAAKGWIAPNWPAEYGGMGLSPAKLLIYLSEQERWGIARFQDQGIRMIGPMLFTHGTERQRELFLPGILSCEHRYCQGYSEPEAGSDLASLRTRARRDGDNYVLDGHKIWTTMAHDVTHIMVLARTDPDAPKHQGISFLIAPLDTPGITVRPIRDIAGHSELCEVFFDGARVPVEHRIGEEGDGWRVGNSVLSFERIHIGTPSMPAYALERLRRLGHLGRDGPAVADLELDLRHLRDLYGEFAAVVRDGGTPGPDVSILKIWATELTRRIGDLICDAAGPAGAVREPLDVDGEPFEVLDVFYKALPSTIYGGSNDIQRDVVAKRVLGLPSLPTPTS